ncbi:hypothetical protein J6590_073884 [Homalodisca vitripennis]|nr:hypothetical protein J6590_073884 [Homalodisca vitripennis]
MGSITLGRQVQRLTRINQPPIPTCLGLTGIPVLPRPGLSHRPLPSSSSALSPPLHQHTNVPKKEETTDPAFSSIGKQISFRFRTKLSKRSCHLDTSRSVVEALSMSPTILVK